MIGEESELLSSKPLGAHTKARMRLIHRLRGRVTGILLGTLCGYIVGWALGWSMFDPFSDIWALTGLIGGIVGLCLGTRSGFWKHAGLLVGTTFCLYIGWILRTLLFGDVPGGMGVFFVIGGAITGALIGSHEIFHEGSPGLRVLVLALVVGYFGGFIIDWIAMKALGIVSEEPLIVIHAPAVIFSALIGSLLGVLSGKSRIESDVEE